MSHRRSRSGSPSRPLPTTNSNDPRDIERRIFVGNLPTTTMDKRDLEDMFSPYGKIHALSIFKGYGFVQFERVQDAEAAKAGHKGRMYKGYQIDVNMAAERMRPKTAQSRASPPRRNPYGGYGEGREGREPRPRSRSPMHGRDSRDHRDGRDGREPGRESRPAPHPRDHEPRDYDRYRGPESREKDPREPPYRGEAYDRYYRDAAPDDYYRKKEDPYRDPHRDPWNGRGREPEEEHVRPDERRRNELYRQYYEELQRRYDTERPVDCSVIVVNKVQNPSCREYAETVGRKVRDLGMVVDLIFLNTEVSLTQALEDVGRARTPFAIIITQQHQVHRSCTVNILFGTPQEHRNMPMEDAMVLVAHNYETYKVENRDKEREETARKAAEMADKVLMREPDRESHPVTLLPTITLLSESRFVTPEELESMISYLSNKRERLLRAADPHAADRPSATTQHEAPPSQIMPPPSSHASQGHPPPHSSHMGLPTTSIPPANPNHQQELQAKILSLFNSGAGAASSATSSSMTPQVSSYASSLSVQQPPSIAPVSMPPMGARPPMRPSGVPPSGPPPGYGLPPGRMAAPSGGINFDNPSVQKALDTLIQSGPPLNHMASADSSAPLRPGQGMGPPPSMYPRHYPSF